MNGDGATDRGNGRHRNAVEDRAVFDTDQTLSDIDQNLSDIDRISADRDEAAAASDQAAADLDQARADEGRPRVSGPAMDAFLASETSRAASSSSRRATHGSRLRTSRTRATVSTVRDRAAAFRDEMARHRDERAMAIDLELDRSNDPLAAKLRHVRALAADDRAKAAADRERAARDRISAARERSRLEAALDEAHLDDRTGAFRRGMGRLAIDLEIAHARRGDGRFVMVVVDVDGLRKINERGGHAAGDRVLETLVRTMRAHLRPFDPIVRYAGDEFVCGMGGVSLPLAARRFEVIEQAVRAEAHASIKVGLASLEPDEPLERLLDRAYRSAADRGRRVALALG